MKLVKIHIKNFRRIKDAEIQLASASFVIGPNNSGKTSVIDAIDALLSLKTEKLIESDFRIQEDGTRSDTIELTGFFSDISEEEANHRGFKGRVINGQFVYKKTYNIVKASAPKIESVVYPSEIKPEYKEAKTVQDLLNSGLSLDLILERTGKGKPEDKLSKNWEKDFIEVLEFLTNESPVFEENPGGFASNVLSKLPRVIRISSMINTSDFNGENSKGLLGECLSLLFDDQVRDNELAKDIQSKLTELETSMNPKTEGSLIKALTEEVNGIISSIFPDCGIEVTPNLQSLTDILKPKYDVSLFSNVRTKIDRQGTGLLRTAAFAMLRYHSNLKTNRKIETRPILVAFEEPEIYLHPSAANLLRDTLYLLGRTDQIVCNTHSPWMIDLTQDPLSLTKMEIDSTGFVSSRNFGVSSAFSKLTNDDKLRVKMIQQFDDELSRVFFASRVVVVEGDTEMLVIKNTLKAIPDDIRKQILFHVQIVRARGKASIISLVKYLQDLGIVPFVLHDRDKGIAGAEKFNKPISDAVNDPSRLVTNDENIEQVLGYDPPSSDKPFKAYDFTKSWSKCSDIPINWKKNFEILFGVKLDETN